MMRVTKREFKKRFLELVDKKLEALPAEGYIEDMFDEAYKILNENARRHNYQLGR